MFLLLSQEFHSSLPNAVPCRVEEIRSEGFEPFAGQKIPEITAEEEQGGVPEDSASNLGPLPGRGAIPRKGGS